MIFISKKESGNIFFQIFLYLMFFPHIVFLCYFKNHSFLKAQLSLTLQILATYNGYVVPGKGNDMTMLSRQEYLLRLRRLKLSATRIWRDDETFLVNN